MTPPASLARSDENKALVTRLFERHHQHLPCCVSSKLVKLRLAQGVDARDLPLHVVPERTEKQRADQPRARAPRRTALATQSSLLGLRCGAVSTRGQADRRVVGPGLGGR